MIILEHERGVDDKLIVKTYSGRGWERTYRLIKRDAGFELYKLSKPKNNGHAHTISERYLSNDDLTPQVRDVIEDKGFSIAG